MPSKSYKSKSKKQAEADRKEAMEYSAKIYILVDEVAVTTKDPTLYLHQLLTEIGGVNVFGEPPSAVNKEAYKTLYYKVKKHLEKGNAKHQKYKEAENSLSQ